MPLITKKQGLGSIYGGKIASINYNFQTASEAATCTLTVVSQNNNFVKPKLNEQITIPPFGISMILMESTSRKDEKQTVLQLELIESISRILDRELVLIYGEHTDPNYKMDNDLYLNYRSFYVPKDSFPSGVLFNPNIDFPNVNRDYLKDHGGGINVIGFPRATFIRNFSNNITGRNSLRQEPQWASFDARRLNNEISTLKERFVYSSENAGNLVINYGYTLKNLYNLIVSKGVRFNANSVSLMQEDNVLFSESGTLRDVLSSCLGKLGRSFYIDPLTQQIHVITNADVARINTLLISQFSSFQNVAGATQISLTESIKDVSANHFVVKGDIDFSDINRNNNDKTPERMRKQVLYKLDADSLAGDLKKADIDLIKRIAPLIYEIGDEKSINTYIYALGLAYPTDKWGTLYGIKEYRAGDFEEKSKNEEESAPMWQQILSDDYSNHDFVFYDTTKTVGGRKLYQGESSTVMARSASDAGYLQSIQDFMSLWAGTYFSAPMSKLQIESRQYQEQAKWMLGLDNSFNFVVLHGETFIGEVQELQFLYRLLKRIGAKTTYRVKDIASKAYGNALGQGDYFLLGTRAMFGGGNFDSEQINRDIRSNFYLFDYPRNEIRYLIYTKDALNTVKRVEKACLDSFEKEKKKVKDKLVVRYSSYEPDSDPDNGSNEDEIHETPEIFSLRNIRSRVINFSKRGLTVISNRFAEMKLLLNKFNELNPEFSGPFITTDIEYYRPPLRTDFDMSKGVESISVAMSDSGVTTSIKYSSRKFAEVDVAILKDMLGANAAKFTKSLPVKAFERNLNGD
jgi:hypothetical protein